MSCLSSFLGKSSIILAQSYEKACMTGAGIGVRYASKKTGGSTRNKKGSTRPKHRGLKVNDGCTVTAGTLLVTQLSLRFHPGLNVGFGKNGTLFALEHGRVAITCERIEPDLQHTWIQRVYAGKDLSNVHKKYLNVISEPQHCRFKLQESI